MNADIITIGEELLIGQVVNTNSSWIAEQLNGAGISVRRITSVADNQEEIINVLTEAENRSDLVMISGGLGPTADDVTKGALCEYFDTRLVTHPEVLNDITGLFRARGYQLSQRNKQQAMVPEKAVVLRNPNGTAPGLWFEKKNKIFVALPGVPYEMKHMISEVVLPQLRKWAGQLHIIHKTILTQGIGESFLSDIISSWETNLPPEIQLAYLPSPGMVRIRITGKGTDKEKVNRIVDQEKQKLEELISQYIWGYDRDTLEEVTGKILKERNQTVCTAESCTGGYIAHHIITVPGSSEWYKGSVVAYSNEIKEKVLNVDKKLLEEHGAVSQQVVEAMAGEALNIFGADYSVAVSGIAGPDGGTPAKPVGTVWIAIGSRGKIISRKFLFGDNRERNILRSVMAALNMLRNFLITGKNLEY